jgi:predicted MFS family arabinose efflux permease
MADAPAPSDWSRSRTADQPGALRLATAGIGVVGATFGMARYGYGLLLPEIRASHGLSSGVLGLIAAGSYLSYLVASAVVGVLATRLSARRLVALGGWFATGGMLLAGLSETPHVLALGVFIAGAGCGVVVPPFSDAVQTLVAPARRARTLAAISAGTGYGVAVAVPIAIVAGGAWRSAWLGFAAVSLLATVWAMRVLPARRVSPEACRPPRISRRWLICPRSGPLLAGGFLIGLGTSVYWTFAVDYLAEAGSMPGGTSRLFLAVVGVAIVAGSFAGDLLHRTSAHGAFVGLVFLLAGSLCLLAVAPSSIVAAAISGVLFGGAFSLVVAIQVIWAALVFEERPSAGLAALMFTLGLGLLAGPPVAGVLADAVGLGVVFLLGAGVIAVVGAMPPRERLVPVAATC